VSWSPLPMIESAASELLPTADARSKARAQAWAVRIALGLLCAAFFWLQVRYCRHLPLVMDELQGASAVYQLRNLVPYVDFTPYKNVVGYYLQLPFMLLYRDLWSQMMAVKIGMAGITALVLFGCGCALVRVIRADAVVLATAVLLAMSTFLERAAELRVDMLTSLAGLVSLVLLLSRRYAWAGFACGLSFLISQKGVYFFVAGSFALLGRGLFLAREQWRWRDAALFAVTALAMIGVYLLAFGAIGSFDAVADMALSKPAQIALADDYKNLGRFWLITVQRNPYFYSLAVLGIGGALERAKRSQSELDWMIFAYGGAVLLLCVGHKQPWPYFFVLLLPTLWVPIARTIEQLSPRGWMFWTAYLLFGLLYPLYTRVPVVLARDSGHQRYTVELAQRLLKKGDTYLAGTNMVYTREQSPGTLAWLDKPNLDALRHISSTELIADLHRKPPKLVIGNYRIDALPVTVRKAIRADYDHLWASVWYYAPTIHDQHFDLGYTGHYRLGVEQSIQIDDQVVPPGSSIYLKAGPHVSNVIGFKLRLIPPQKVLENLALKHRMPADLFPSVYDY
jgi:hypothetical protein